MSSYKFNKNYFTGFRSINDLNTLLYDFTPSYEWLRNGYNSSVNALKAFFNFKEIKDAINNKEWAKVFKYHNESKFPEYTPFSAPVMLYILQLMGIDPLEDMTDEEVEDIFPGDWFNAFSKEE